MKKIFLTVFESITVLFFLFSCNDKAKDRTWNDCPVVAQKDKNGVVVCNIDLIRDTIDLPVSSLLSDFEVIRLENSDDALISNGLVWPSEHYMGIYSSQVNAYKLFDRKGTFLRNITTRGQGPDEFIFAIYDSYIDETEGKIYILSMLAEKIMVFDLQGNPLKPISLPFRVHKGKMKINVKERTLLMLALPFTDTPYAVWKQDFDGNIIQSVPAGRFVIVPADYANEIDADFNGNAIDYYLSRTTYMTDTLYHYDENRNTLIPQFTAHFINDVKDHGYRELPGYYELCLDAYSSNSSLILIDRQTLKGAYVRYKLDMLGGIYGNFIWFHHGYCTANVYPSDLKKWLETALSRSKDLPVETRKKAEELNNSITDDDNNIILIGKLKQVNF